MVRVWMVLVVLLVSTTANAERYVKHKLGFEYVPLDGMPVHAGTPKKRVAVFSARSKGSASDPRPVERARVVVQLDDKVDAEVTPGMQDDVMQMVVERYTSLHGGKIRTQQFRETPCDDEASAATCYAGYGFFYGSMSERNGVTHARLFTRGKKRFVVLGFVAYREAGGTREAADALAKEYVGGVR